MKSADFADLLVGEQVPKAGEQVKLSLVKVELRLAKTASEIEADKKAAEAKAQLDKAKDELKFAAQNECSNYWKIQLAAQFPGVKTKVHDIIGGKVTLLDQGSFFVKINADVNGAPVFVTCTVSGTEADHMIVENGELVR